MNFFRATIITIIMMIIYYYIPRFRPLFSLPSPHFDSSFRSPPLISTPLFAALPSFRRVAHISFGALARGMASMCDSVLERLLAVKSARPGTCVGLSDKEAAALVAAAEEAVSSQPMLLELSAPLQIVGDIHGQFLDLLRLFEFKGLPPDARYLFLGDYVDRGPNGLECMFMLMALKIKYPDQVWLLRGNHECAAINRIYGFYDECKRRYSVKLWRSFQELFNALPLAAVSGSAGTHL